MGGAERGVRPPGMADAARAAGVSARMLSGHRSGRDEPRARGSSPSSGSGTAKTTPRQFLSSGRSRSIGLVTTLRTTPYARRTPTSGTGSAADAAGCSVSVASTVSPGTSAVESALTRLAGQGAEGVVLVTR